MAITPGAGYQVDPNNPNAVIPIVGAPQTGSTSIGATNQQPAASAPVTPSPLPATAASPTAAPAPQTDTTSTPQPSTSPAQPSTTQSATPTQGQAQSAPPTANLQPGAQGQDVQNLQNYLVQMGYLTADQVSTGAGTYGPQTTAAVAKLQKDLGINAGSAAGSYGPQTQAALAQKYQGLFSSMKGSTVPGTPSQASSAIDNALQQQTDSTSDPVFGSLTSAMQPIMQSLTQVLNNVNNPALSAVSLQDEYNQLRDQYNLPQMNAQMMNMQNIMNGTEQDIRDEVTQAGGFATDSQVQAIAASRNKVIIKQYNALATQYDAAQQNVQAQMQYAQQDQSTSLQRSQLSASITESLASISTQMMQMGMTMQNNARSAAQYNVTQMGYTGLAASAQGNPQMLSYYENILGLAPGTLSDPNALASMDTYKNQQLQINNYRAAIAAFQAGYGGGTGGGSSITAPPGQVGITPVDLTTLNRPAWLSSSVPLSMTADQMNEYTQAQTSAHVDPGTNNIVAPGIGYYVHQSDGSYVLQAALPSPTDTQYDQVKQTIASAPPFSGSPRVTGQWTTATNKELSAFKDLGTYKVLSSVAPYMANIRAAQVNPGSISDLELLDSYVRLSKGGTGQVTGDQVNIALKGASIADNVNVLEQKLQNGGVLSDNQRQQLIQLASNVYNENADDYKKIYVQATQGLQAQGIPVQFWNNLPDLNSLLSGNSLQ